MGKLINVCMYVCMYILVGARYAFRAALLVAVCSFRRRPVGMGTPMSGVGSQCYSLRRGGVLSGHTTRNSAEASIKWIAFWWIRAALRSSLSCRLEVTLTVSHSSVGTCSSPPYIGGDWCNRSVKRDGTPMCRNNFFLIFIHFVGYRTRSNGSK
jgi:hypothetical protein